MSFHPYHTMNYGDVTALVRMSCYEDDTMLGHCLCTSHSFSERHYPKRGCSDTSKLMGSVTDAIRVTTRRYLSADGFLSSTRTLKFRELDDHNISQMAISWCVLQHSLIRLSTMRGWCFSRPSYSLECLEHLGNRLASSSVAGLLSVSSTLPVLPNTLEPCRFWFSRVLPHLVKLRNNRLVVVRDASSSTEAPIGAPEKTSCAPSMPAS